MSVIPKKPRPFGILEFFERGGDAARTRWEKWIDRSHHPMGCWEWQGCSSTSVFSKRFPASFRFPMKLDGKNYRPSCARIAWSLHYKIEFPYELYACHTCDNPRCVNPHHIWVGDVAQNNHDAIRKGRRGPSYEQKKAVVEKYLQGCAPKDLRMQFNINAESVSTILKSPDVIRKYGMTLPAYKRKLIREKGLPDASSDNKT